MSFNFNFATPTEDKKKDNQPSINNIINPSSVEKVP
jgi:hypothetical protein